MAKDQDQHDEPTPVVIVGMACRFPGDASRPEALWTALSAGESAWSEFPQDRLNINGFYHPSPERSDSVGYQTVLESVQETDNDENSSTSRAPIS